MKKFTLILALIILLNFNLANAEGFIDMVDKSHWSFDALNYVCSENIIQGFDDSTIRPNATLTRAQMAAIVVRKYGNGSKAEINHYTDILKTAWYYDYFSEAVSMGLFMGDGTGLMYPDKNISRQEAFVVIGRTLKLEESFGDTSFEDDNKISGWAKGMIKALYEKKYISGDENRMANPHSEITRAEFAQILYNINYNNELSEKENKNKTGTTGKPFCGSASEGSSTIPEKTDKVENNTGFSEGDSYSSDIFDE